MHDASHRTVPVRIAHVDRPCGAEMSEISRSSRTTTVESSMKSEHTLYLACKDSPQCAFFFELSLVLFLHFIASTVSLHCLCCFLFLNATNRQLRSVLDSAKHIHCGGPAALSYPSSIVKKRRSSLSSIARLGIISASGSQCM